MRLIYFSLLEIRVFESNEELKVLLEDVQMPTKEHGTISLHGYSKYLIDLRLFTLCREMEFVTFSVGETGICLLP